ncbi:MAG: hypothetical protein K6G30_04275 [Acetatifactor sp.]|nr:hypothetical protein [Acetatifactor sp.]
MKKLFAFISVLAACTAFMFAEVTAKKNADGSVEVTFFYGNPRASEVLLAGDFTNWQDGALPMEKGEKGFSLTKTFKASDVLTYKFISDGNWTTDLRAPEFVDDGFGGKNSRAELADLIGGGDDDGAAKAKINFVSWSMIGAQGTYRTAAATDPSKKGLDLDSATLGFKSYDKFVGNFLPNCPLFIELAISERELDPVQNGGNLYLYKVDDYGNDEVTWEDGLKELVNGLVAHPVSYLAGTTNNSVEGDGGADKTGPGSNPFLGHLKFGFSTPWVKYITGFNYAKPTAQANILWTTVDGSNWDAGYDHVGGFNEFTIGDKAVATLEEATGLKFNLVFAPNMSANRKGGKYGLWSILGVSNDIFAVEAQYNAFYADDYIFYKPFEQDAIVGGKFSLSDIGLTFGAQMLMTFYDNIDLVPGYNAAKSRVDGFWDVMGFTGYSRSAVVFDDSFDFDKNTAGEVKVGYKNDIVNVNVDWRYRGWESNMLYVHDHHSDNGKDSQKAQLGTLNSQRVTVDATFTLLDEALSINFAPYFETQFSTDKWEDYAAVYAANETANSRIDLHSKDSKKIVGYLQADYNLEDVIGYKSSVSAYGKVKYVTEDEDKFSGYDSNFLFSNAGLKFSMSELGDIFKGFDVYYGLNNSHSQFMWNTLVGELKFAQNMKADIAFGLRTKTAEGKEDNNNPFGFGVGFAKQFQSFKKPTVYCQFVYDMDPFKNFGDGQDALNLDGYEIGDKSIKDGADSPAQDAVDVYAGHAAVRVGIRWDI